MIFRKIAPTLGLALVLAFTVPAGASANWTHGQEGKELASSASVTLSGSIAYEGEFGSVSCSEADIKATLTPGSEGHVESFSIPPLSCIIGGGLKALGCTSLEKIEPTNLGWPIDAKAKDIEITSYITHFYFKGGIFCPKKITIEGLHTATPDKLKGITRVTLGGKLKLSIGGEAIVKGELNLSPSGTYGLE
jgi:hypothetical protein